MRVPGFVAALLLIVVHIPLALAIRQFDTLATFHALVVFALGLSLALFGRRPMQVAYVAAYITGAEVLWRMSDAQIPWEFGKYGTAVLFIVALMRVPRLKLAGLPLLYFALLLPSTLLTVLSLPAVEARQQISFNLSGPFALATSALFFAHVKLSRPQVLKLFLALLIPIAGTSCVTFFGIMNAANLSFGSESASILSGGFGPNQVAAALGLGALLAFWFLMDAEANWSVRTAAFGGMILLLIQSALTFSRGGVYNAVGAIALAALLLLRNPRTRMTFVFVAVLLFAANYFLTFPLLNSFTGGTLSERFQDTSLTGRDVLIQADLQTWIKNFAWGVGPGRSALMHLALFRDSASHTEFSRMVAEHGALGLVSLLLLIFMALKNVMSVRSTAGKAISASLVAWSFLFMLNEAMRLVAPSFLLGVTCATVMIGEKARSASLQTRPNGRNTTIDSSGWPLGAEAPRRRNVS